MRQVLSTAITAMIVAALTAVSISALAQDAPTTERTVAPAAVSNINAHRVDGKHAVGFTNKRLARRNKLVATNKQGFLPSNIVKPLWGTIKNKPAPFADGQISWSELQGIPAGFADGVDAGDTTTSYIAAESPDIAAGHATTVAVTYPASQDLEISVIPQGDGLWATTMASSASNLGDEIIYRSGNTINHYLYFQNYGGSTDRLKVRITIFNDGLVAPAAAKRLVTAKVVKGRKLPQP